MCSSGRGQVLIPWPNRVAGWQLRVRRPEHQLALDRAGTATRSTASSAGRLDACAEREPRSCRDGARAPSAARLSVLARDQHRVRALGQRASRVRTTATNVGRRACPFGSGAHPYLTVGTPPVDARDPARARADVLRPRRARHPDRLGAVDGTARLPQPRPIGETMLDHAFTDLERDEDGLARVELRDPRRRRRVTLWVDEAYAYLMLFTGDPLPDVDRRSLAVEPMTCPPNAFRSGEALIILEPGESFSGRWGISPGAWASSRAGMNSGQSAGDSARHRVVIVGGGFGGLFAAKFLRRAAGRRHALDRRNHHLFQPLLYQVATGHPVAGRDRAAAARDILRAQERQRRARRGRPASTSSARDRSRDPAADGRRRGALRQPDRRRRRRAVLLRPRRVRALRARHEDHRRRAGAPRAGSSARSRWPRSSAIRRGAAGVADVRRRRRRADRRRDRRADRASWPRAALERELPHASTRRRSRVLLFDGGDEIARHVRRPALGQATRRARALGVELRMELGRHRRRRRRASTSRAPDGATSASRRAP